MDTQMDSHPIGDTTMTTTLPLFDQDALQAAMDRHPAGKGRPTVLDQALALQDTLSRIRARAVRELSRPMRGDTVTARHPRTRDMQDATVYWVSPTRGTLMVRFADGEFGYEY